MKKIFLALVVLCCAFALYAQDMTLYSPVNYQVFQRQTKSVGYITFSGKTSSDAVRVKITGKDYKNKTVKIEKTIKTDKFGAFKKDIETPAGGWYKVSYNWTVNGTSYEKDIEKVGVGEIIIGAGQSNSTNCGQFPSKQESGMVASTDGINWKYADDPQIGVHDGTQGGSLYPGLGDALYKEFNVPIGVAATGWGGTSVEQWQFDAAPLNGQINLYNYFMRRVYQFGKDGFRCVIWHQGESNVGNPTDVFYNNMVRLIEKSREDAKWDIPWFVAKVSYHNPNMRGNDEIRNAHQKLWDTGVAFQGPDTDQLQEEYRDYDGQGIHFGLKGLKKHGEMWAEFLIPYIHSQID